MTNKLNYKLIDLNHFIFYLVTIDVPSNLGIFAGRSVSLSGGPLLEALLPLRSLLTDVELSTEVGIFADDKLFTGLALLDVLFVPRTASSLIKCAVVLVVLSTFFRTSLIDVVCGILLLFFTLETEHNGADMDEDTDATEQFKD